jgi:hypothetical protein
MFGTSSRGMGVTVTGAGGGQADMGRQLRLVCCWPFTSGCTFSHLVRCLGVSRHVADMAKPALLTLCLQLAHGGSGHSRTGPDRRRQGRSADAGQISSWSNSFQPSNCHRFRVTLQLLGFLQLGRQCAPLLTEKAFIWLFCSDRYNRASRASNVFSFRTCLVPVFSVSMKACGIVEKWVRNSSGLELPILFIEFELCHVALAFASPFHFGAPAWVARWSTFFHQSR